MGAGPRWLIGTDRYGTHPLSPPLRTPASRCSSGPPARATSTPICAIPPRAACPDIEFAPFSVTYSSRPAPAPPGPPTAQDIWVAQGTRSLTWDVDSGDWSVVVMNQDGSRGVTAGVGAGAKVPYLTTLGFVALGLGIAFILATADADALRHPPASVRKLVRTP